MSCRNMYDPGRITLPIRNIFLEFAWVTVTVTWGLYMYSLRLRKITSESSLGVKSAAWISLINGRDIFPSGLTVTSMVNSGLFQTKTWRTSSGPIRYDFVADNRSSSNRRGSVAGGVVEGTSGGGSGNATGPPLERSTAARGAGTGAAVSILDACDGVGSLVRASFSCGIGRKVGGGGWAISSLFAGGGNSATAVAGGVVEGISGGGSENATGPPLVGSTAARGAGTGAAVSTRITDGGGSSWVRASSTGGNGTTAGGGVWTTPSLPTGGGIGALAVAGRVE